ncbi:MAG: FkbM family methyltransferase [Chloroflexota bacterium]
MPSISLISELAQSTVEVILNSPRRGLISHLKVRVAEGIRQALVKLCDPLIGYELEGTAIKLPLSHNLPMYRRSFPQYSANIGRIARAVKEKYPQLTVVDVGANVGDTAAILQAAGGLSILCIEGDTRFASILAHNAKRMGHHIVIETCFVGAFSGEMRGQVCVQAGTAHLMAVSSLQTTLRLETLTSILLRHPDFAHAKLVKVDTDGMDTAILCQDPSLLQSLRPVVFFEYDPFFFHKFGFDGFTVFETLRRAGYASALFYDNTGDYLLAANLDDRQLLEDIDGYYTGRSGKRYCDICAFHSEDEDLSQSIRMTELSFFRAQRTGTRPQ